jgi:16S rRNA (cytosine967-C5)-methyltransferase
MSAIPASAPTANPNDAWSTTVRLLVRWSGAEERVDWLLDSLPSDLGGGERARVQALLLGTLRHLGRIDAALDELVSRPPRAIVRSALRVAGFEFLTQPGDEGHTAKVCHHLVDQVRRLASPQEAAFANAVGRKLALRLAEPLTKPGADSSAEEWAHYYSHPTWFISRAWDQWGKDTTLKWLEWNQSEAPVVVRWRESDRTAVAAIDWLEPLAGADGFYTVAKGHGPALRALIDSDQIHVQDAATCPAIDLLAPQPDEVVLDLCAAPGGKSLAIGDRMQRGKIVAVDLAGRRQPRLIENLARLPSGVEGIAVGAHIMRGLGRELLKRKLPETYDAVLIDVPCSNTGVMRHRVDVRWRLNEGSFRRHARQQLDLLLAAAERVAPGGRLVYSTCSLDREENEPIVNAFLRRQRGDFVLEDSCISLPWETGYDGAAAFRLRRVGPA